MPTRSPSILNPVLTGLLALALPACAGAPASVESAALVADAAPPVYFESDLAERPGLVAEAEKPLVLEIEPEGQAPVPVRYVRGVEEEVRWEGAGGGIAELHNEHGQLIWRVSEGGEGFSGTIPAGLYTLTVRGGQLADVRRLVIEPEVEDTRQLRTIFWRESNPSNRGPETPTFRYGGIVNDLAGRDFSGQDLRKADFWASQLDRVSFVGAQLPQKSYYCTFRGCNLDGAIFKESRIRFVGFTGCSFRGADLSRSQIDYYSVNDCNFKGANLEGAEFSNYRTYPDPGPMNSNSFEGANLKGAKFSYTILNDCNFEGANLLGVRLVDSHARNVRGVCSCSPGCGFANAQEHLSGAS